MPHLRNTPTVPVKAPQGQPDATITRRRPYDSSPIPNNLYSAQRRVLGHQERGIQMQLRQEFLQEHPRIATIAKARANFESARLSRLAHNSGTLTFQLPAELLLHIFEYRVFDNDIPNPDIYGWIRQTWIAEISHVCSRWRTLALGYPRLWTNILNFADVHVAEAMISRSCNIPLSIRVHISDPFREDAYFDAIFTNLRQVVSRIRTLRLSGEERGSFSFGCFHLARLFEVTTADFHRAPDTSMHDTLSTRALQAPTSILSEFEAKTTDYVVLETHTFGRYASSLRSIRLINYTLTWSKHSLKPFANLTSLAMRSQHRKPEPRHTTSTILRSRVEISVLIPLLPTFPLLNRLELGNIFKPFSEQDFIWSSSHQVPEYLPRLTHLSLEASLIHCTKFFEHVTFPDSANLMLTMLERGILKKCEIMDFESVLISLQGRSEYLRYPLFLGLQIPVQAAPAYEICRPIIMHLGNNLATSVSEAQEREPVPRFQISAVFSLENIQSLLHLFQLKQIQVAHIEARWIEHPLWEALSKLPELHTLRLSQVDWGFLNEVDPLESTTRFIETALTSVANNSREAFRSLTTICLHECFFSSSYALPPSLPIGTMGWNDPRAAFSFRRLLRAEYASNLSLRFVDQTLELYRLVEFLTQRKINGQYLHLHLIHCKDISTADILTLTNAVACMTVE